MEFVHRSLLHFGFIVRDSIREFGEYRPGIEELGVKVLGRFETSAHDEDFGRHVAGAWWFGGFYLGEELIEHPKQLEEQVRMCVLEKMLN
jgi:hypothetical protein